MLRLPRDVISRLDDGRHVGRCITGIGCVCAVGNKNHLASSRPEVGEESLNVGHQHLLDAIKPVARAVRLSPLSQKFAKAHVPVPSGVLHVDNDQRRAGWIEGKGLAEAVDETGLCHCQDSL